MLVIVLLVSLLVRIECKTGDKAIAACRAFAQPMLECRNILYPSFRVRVPIDLLLYPHMVLIGFRMLEESPPKWQCGGTLISDSWVLTAAHCLEDPHTGAASDLRIGTATFEFEETENLDQSRRISKTIAYPKYQPPAKYHDIALLKANEPFILSRDVRIACLPYRDLEVSTATVIGFGTTTSGAAVGSQTLMAVEVDIIDSGVCNKSMKSAIRRGKLKHGITSGLICAGDFEHGGKDACQGDSGGPLQVMPEGIDCIKTFPLHVVIGIASFGNHCGYKKSPGMYTRVFHYLDWIESVVWP